ncbi:hypothetical protein FXO37_33391 [Capsicum annuum]|nr:hypothetical protein FXO37_33391 [Capsicum annuum]
MQVAPEAIRPRVRLPGRHASRRPPRIAPQSRGALSSRGGYWPPERLELAAGLNTSPRRRMLRQVVVVTQLSLSSRLEVFRDAECAISAQRRVENNVCAWRHVAIRGFCDHRVQCWRRLQ